MPFRVWCIAGLDSPAWAQNVRENFSRATDGVHAHLVVVENGDGVGAWGTPGKYSPCTVVRSETGCANYINAGLKLVREFEEPGDWFAKFDSDDYYGRGWFHQHKGLAESGVRAAAASSVFVRMANWKTFFVDFEVTLGDILSNSKVLHGPTLAAEVSVSLDFPTPKEAWGEDADWVDAMRASGVQFHALSEHGFTYCRHRDRNHAFPVPDEFLLGVYPNAKVYDVGLWDRAVVDGLVPLKKLVEVPFNPADMVMAGEALMAAASG